MSRAEGRAITREAQNAAKTINKFTPNQLKVIDQIVKGRSNEQVQMAIVSHLRVVTASLYEHGFNSNQIDDILNVANKLKEEENAKAAKLNEELKKGGDIEMVRKKIEDAIVNAIKELIATGKNRKETIDETLFKFPNMSKAMIINAYAQVKEELKPDDPEVEKAMEYIFEEDKDMNNKVEESKNNGVDAVVKGATATASNLSPQVKALKILEEKRTVKVQGENGIYEGETGKGIILRKDDATISFQTKDQLDIWVAEVRQVLDMI
jgi:hypothetical protein